MVLLRVRNFTGTCKSVAWRSQRAWHSNIWKDATDLVGARLAFHGRFNGLRNFCCKTAQFCATRRESELAGTPSVSSIAQAGENVRKNSFLIRNPVLYPADQRVHFAATLYFSRVGAAWGSRCYPL